MLAGTTYQLAINGGPNPLHGGVRGFFKVRWKVELFECEAGVGVIFTYTSPDGEEGFFLPTEVPFKQPTISSDARRRKRSGCKCRVQIA